MESGEIEQIAKTTGNPVLVVDLRGLGETKKAGKYRGINELLGPDWKDTYLISLLGKSNVGMRVEDIWQLVRAMRKEAKNKSLKPRLVAVGEAAIPALHAAALEPELFSDVNISGSVDSWTAVLEATLARHQNSNLVFGALREYDLPMLRDLLGDQLTNEGSINPDGTPLQ